MNTLLLKLIGGAAVLGIVLALVSHHRSVVAQRDAFSDSLTLCRSTNKTNTETIQALRDAEIENNAAYEALLARSQEQADELERLEAERQERNDETIEYVVREADGDACAGQPMPDALRLRILP